MFFHAHLSTSNTLSRDRADEPRETFGTLLREARDAVRQARARRSAPATMGGEDHEATTARITCAS